jgi:intracellular sulfur oxidation DsrE/DsrF family protein
MSVNKQFPPTGRRSFLGSLATGAAAFSIASLSAPLSLQAAADRMPSESIEDIPSVTSDPDEWFNKIKGKHRAVFDVPGPHDVFPFAWPRVFLITNGKTGTSEKECGVVVVLRHNAIGYAMNESVWEKYKLGEVLEIDDPITKSRAVKNPFWKPAPGTYKVPGLGPVAIGINELQESGVMFCVCDMAMTVYSAAVAGASNADPAAIKKEWSEGLLPNIQPVPSGVWALGRAHEKGCAYIYAS